MTIAEKLTLIAQNEQKVYNAGYEKGKSEGGGGEVTLQEKTITENGTYTPDAGFDGFSKVSVNVAKGGDGYIKPSGTFTITENGSYDITTYKTVVVNIGIKYSEDLEYEKDGTQYYLIGIGFCEDTDIIIPPLYDGLPVVSIGYGAFSYNSDITSVVIPDTVTSIEDEAFDSCDSLTSVITGKNLREIGSYAFNSCTSLTNIVLGDNVWRIYEYAFADCWELETIVMPEVMSEIGDSAFDGCDALYRVDFSSFQQGDEPPTLGSDALSTASSELQVKVPKGDVDLWKDATNWSELDIVEEFTN